MTLYRLFAVGLILAVSLTLTVSLASCANQSETHARIAVATNFLNTAQKLEAAFEAETDFTIDLVSGSTGQLYTQIINGAPYDAFLSADAARITRLVETGHGVDGTQAQYAQGRLVLYGADNAEDVMKAGDLKKLAIANPEIAPYGLAAKQVLESLQLSEFVADRLVYGQNVGQAYGFVKTKNADLGFVSLSQMQEEDDTYWVVPKTYYEPIAQDSVLLSFGETNQAARRFLDYLKSSQAKEIIQASGYEVSPND